MKVLVVYAHPNPNSFNHAILDSFTKGLEEKGHKYEIVDLYKIDFDPRTKIEDLSQFSGGQLPKEIIDQQDKITTSDALVFIFPRFDWTYPSILKGWIQRVFSAGFAYKSSKDGPIGLLKLKKALLINTTAAPEEYYKMSGIQEAYEKISNTTLKDWSGIPDVEHVTFYSLPVVDEKTRKAYLEKAEQLGKDF